MLKDFNRTAMVKLAHWSNEYYFYIQQTEATQRHTKQASFAEKLPAAQPDIPGDINSTDI